MKITDQLIGERSKDSSVKNAGVNMERRRDFDTRKWVDDTEEFLKRSGDAYLKLRTNQGIRYVKIKDIQCVKVELL